MNFTSPTHIYNLCNSRIALALFSYYLACWFLSVLDTMWIASLGIIIVIIFSLGIGIGIWSIRNKILIRYPTCTYYIILGILMMDSIRHISFRAQLVWKQGIYQISVWHYLCTFSSCQQGLDFYT